MIIGDKILWRGMECIFEGLDNTYSIQGYLLRNPEGIKCITFCKEELKEVLK